MNLTLELRDIRELYKYLIMMGYTSHEFNEHVHEIKKRLDAYLSHNDAEWFNGFWSAVIEKKVESYSCEVK